MKKGYYAPLTMKGTLLINNVLASCFANVNNHHLAQYYMTPFRYYYKFARFISLYDPFNINKTENLHKQAEQKQPKRKEAKQESKRTYQCR